VAFEKNMICLHELLVVNHRKGGTAICQIEISKRGSHVETYDPDISHPEGLVTITELGKNGY